MKYKIRQLLILLIVSTIAFAAIAQADIFDALKIQGNSPGLGANDLGDIAWDGKSLWVSGSGTLTNLTGEGHSVYDWMSYDNIPGFGKGTISAFYASGDLLVTAWFYEEMIAGQSEKIGDGLSMSFDHGLTWRHIPLTAYFPERAEWAYPGGRTVTWDIVFSGETMWCSTESGFLFKTDDYGETWTRYLPGDDELDFRNYNHYSFCVDVYGDSLWVGTMQGINASFDGGETWSNFSWPLDGSGVPEDQWPGNFVVSVEHNTVGGKTHVWVGSQREMANTGLGVDGICHTDDNGETWEYKTTDYSAWNFAFGFNGANDPKVSDETVLAATDSGLVVSYDLGENWEIIDIRELKIEEGASDKTETTVVNEWEYGTQILGVVVVQDTLWVTSSDGIARSNDWGKNWMILQGITRVKTIDTGERDIGISSRIDDVETFAFPNPFSPSRSDRNYSRTRIQYSLKNDANVTIQIYDYQGRLIHKLLENEYRSGGRDYQEAWNGRDSDNAIVPNGVYFYVIKTDKGDMARDKIMVLD